MEKDLIIKNLIANSEYVLHLNKTDDENIENTLEDIVNTKLTKADFVEIYSKLLINEYKKHNSHRFSTRFLNQMLKNVDESTKCDSANEENYNIIKMNISNKTSDYITTRNYYDLLYMTNKLHYKKSIKDITALLMNNKRLLTSNVIMMSYITTVDYDFKKQYKNEKAIDSMNDAKKVINQYAKRAEINKTKFSISKLNTELKDIFINNLNLESYKELIEDKNIKEYLDYIEVYEHRIDKKTKSELGKTMMSELQKNLWDGSFFISMYLTRFCKDIKDLKEEQIIESNDEEDIYSLTYKFFTEQYNLNNEFHFKVLFVNEFIMFMRLYDKDEELNEILDMRL